MQRATSSGKKRGALLFIVCSAILSLGALTWLGMNDWSVQKSLDRITGEAPSPEKEEGSLQAGHDEEEDDKKDEDSKEASKDEPKEELIDATKYVEGQKLPKKPTYIDGILMANKQHPLPSTFDPGEDPEAREAFEELAAAASLEGYRLTAFSTYRAYERQVELYDNYVARDGVKEADRYSARPGYSEHQTGLAFDIGEVNQEQHWANSSFADTAAGKWLAENAHTYGFVMRYPEGKEQVTGYMYEAWHFRYVGKDIAKEIYKANGTLEEYLGIQ